MVAIPARFTRTQEREWVRRMVTKLAVQDQRRRPSDTELAARAADLSQRYLGGRAKPSSVAWSSNQGRRWGSCTPAEGTIRISTRVRGMPRWVLDYVLLHELAHLECAGHGPEFWALLDAYPRTERARGFLEGFAFAGDAVTDEDPATPLDEDDEGVTPLEPDDDRMTSLELDDDGVVPLEVDDDPATALDEDDHGETPLERHAGDEGR